MRWLCAIALTAAGAATACGRPVPAPARIDDAVAAVPRLAAASALVQAGCFDCLTGALTQYESLREVPVVSQDATAGAVRAAALLALRERELGTSDSHYLEQARALASADENLRARTADALDLIAMMPWRGGSASSSSSQQVDLYRNRTARVDALRVQAGRDELTAYLWLAYACESGAAATLDRDALAAPIAAFAGAPLLRFKLAICRIFDLPALQALVDADPRFQGEVSVYLAANASSLRRLDEAAARYDEAYAWRHSWPAVTVALGNLAMTAEAFDSALDFYDRTLALVADSPDALLGKLRALTYLARHDDAVAFADALLAIGRYPGDAYYWRALNELDLDRLDRAWDDVEAAEKLLFNSDVPKLAGLIAMRRQMPDLARQRLQLSRERNPADCETAYYLDLVFGDLAQWSEVVQQAVTAASCLDAAEARLRAEIADIQMSSDSEDRKVRQVERRQKDIASGARMRATCWFNAAVGSFNLSRAGDVRAFASKVVDDEQFGARARDLVTRLPAR